MRGDLADDRGDDRAEESATSALQKPNNEEELIVGHNAEQA